MENGAVILCGGQSTRMGLDKATLPFGPELMLQRIIRLLSVTVDSRNMVVVAAAGQNLPKLPEGIVITHDHRSHRGPLEGLAAGLSAMNTRVDAVYVTGCDAPLLVPAFVHRMFALASSHDLAVPRDDQRHYPLAAVYRTRILNQIQTLLAADQLRLRSLFDSVLTREVPTAELRDVDPDLSTLVNLNTPFDYHNALQSAGFGTES